jgi:hypothetical protein
LPQPEYVGWIQIVSPPAPAVLRTVADLGAGEREVLAVALSLADPLVVLDDGPARRYAKFLGVPVVGTLGILLKTKAAGRIESIRPLIEELEMLRFRLLPDTREAVIRLAGH